MTATLVSLIEKDYGLRLFCGACKRVSDIDVEAIAAKYGLSVTLTEIGAKAPDNERETSLSVKCAKGTDVRLIASEGQCTSWGGKVEY
jgi:hypothetical protein